MSKYEEAIKLKNEINQISSQWKNFWKLISLSIPEEFVSDPQSKEFFNSISKTIMDSKDFLLGIYLYEKERELKELSQAAWDEMAELFGKTKFLIAPDPNLDLKKEVEPSAPPKIFDSVPERS